MIAVISEGHALLADWLFLIAAVLALLAAIAYAPKVITPKLTVWAGTLVALALCLVAVAWLVL
jgi:hypothetical protein